MITSAIATTRTTMTTTASLTKFTSSKFLSTPANKVDSMEDRLTPLKSILVQEGNDDACEDGDNDDCEDILPSSDNPAWPNVV